MASLADELAKLVDPTPKFVDPEDDINIETAARVVDRFDESSDACLEISKLRQKTTPLLEDIDARYAGKKVSWESFDQAYKADTDSSSGSEDDDDDEVEERLKCLKQQILERTDSVNSASQDLYNDNSSNESGDRSEEEEDFSDRSETGDESDETDAESDETDAESDEEQETDDMVKTFSNIDVNEEIGKGKAVEAQLGLWNRFCESRIRLQKILIPVNQLPQFDVWNNFRNEGGKNYSDALKKAPVAIKSLLDSMLEMQSQLFLNNPETKGFITNVDSFSGAKSDEEISSESENGIDETHVQNKPNLSLEKQNKRKLRLDEYEDILVKRFKSFAPYRNSVIQKWDDKTRLTTGKMSQKSFSAFCQPAVVQINQILQDKQRLIQRTQLKRSLYKILGKKEENENENHLQQSEANSDVVDGHSKRDEHLNCHDPEIFDDDDFYRVLLKDIIEAKTVGMDPDILRTHMELQKNRKKMKKKIDTKASKGRKVRYDPYPKLLSYKAAVNGLYQENTRTGIMKNLFS